MDSNQSRKPQTASRQYLRRRRSGATGYAATATCNYALNDPRLDWLTLYGQGHRFLLDDGLDDYDPRTNFSRCTLSETDLMRDIARHNEVNCRVMMEIVRYLLREH